MITIIKVQRTYLYTPFPSMYTLNGDNNGIEELSVVKICNCGDKTFTLKESWSNALMDVTSLCREACMSAVSSKPRELRWTGSVYTNI